jgi:hypothetical protein
MEGGDPLGRSGLHSSPTSRMAGLTCWSATHFGVANFLTLNGENVSETRNGVVSDYLPDPLSSVAYVVNTSGTITDIFTYWPYVWHL